ncbi:MAG TPA: hypothetical protein VHM91_03260 [Verrucomicrobiales bacterium]|nr:hypothetical protein [Verrucomicrobiales bacterium]
MKTAIEKLLGVNWRSTLTGILTTLTVLCGAWLALPEDTLANPRVWIPALLAALLKTLGDTNAKDRQVSGNPGTGFVVGPSPDEKVRAVRTQKMP